MALALKVGHDRSSHLRKRAHNPLYHRKPLEEQDRRRQAFLNKVKQAGDDRKWESRSEQVKLDFASLLRALTNTDALDFVDFETGLHLEAKAMGT